MRHHGVGQRPPPFGPLRVERPADKSCGPIAGWHAVSANFVLGLAFTITVDNARLLSVPEGAYRYFQMFDLEDKAGYSIFIYRITLAEANRVRELSGLEPLQK